MKLIFLVLLVSCSTFADLVYMREDSLGKTVQLQSAGTLTTMNDQSSKLWALYPDISADGNEFVYCEGKDSQDLHLTYFNKKLNKTLRFFPEFKGMLLHPKFQKNGKAVFFSAPAKSGKNTIYSVKLGKEALTDASVITEGEEAYFPRPSSDGNFLVYQRNVPGKKEIVLFDRLENEKKVLAEGMSPALSFDETQIAYTSKKDGNWNVYVIDRITGKVQQMTDDKKDEMAPTFMADGTLVFATNRSGHFEIVKLEKSEWMTLVSAANEEVDFYSPQFSGETTFKQTVLPEFIGNARSSFGTVTHDGKVYMAGGHQGQEHTYPPESFTDYLVVYDIATKSWTELAPRPAKAHGYQIVAFGNYVYAFGGFAYSADHKPKWKSLKQIDRYDIKNNKWETIGELNAPRSSNVAITVDDKVYLVAGWDSTPKFHNDADGTFHDTIEIFDLKSEKVEVAPYKLQLPLRRALTGIEHNGKILLIGGLGVGASHFELIKLVTEIDPVTGTQKEWSPLPFATFAPAAEILGNELYVFGGMFQTGTMMYEYVSHIYAQDLSSKEWRHTGRYVQETKGFSQVFKLDEKTLGILGGHHYEQGADMPVKTFETFSK